MKITDYPKATELSSSNVFLIDGPGGTKQIDASELPFALMDLANVGMHRMLFRGKNLGSSITPEQKTAIQNGTFEDLWLGDYWVMGGVKWRIADFDYWYNCGDSAFTSHHLVIVPDSSLYDAKMNNSSTTAGGYVGSAMYKTNLAQAKSTISSLFSDSVLSHREYLITTVSSGYPSSGSWTDSTVDLMNEMMVFGGYMYTPSGNGTIKVKRYTSSAKQLALFMVAPMFIHSNSDGARTSYWLRDIANSTAFVCVSNYGAPQDTSATVESGVRPVFAIG